jgi:hypothetical protein
MQPMASVPVRIAMRNVRDSLAAAARISFNRSLANHSIGNALSMRTLPPDVMPAGARYFGEQRGV